MEFLNENQTGKSSWCNLIIWVLSVTFFVFLLFSSTGLAMDENQTILYLFSRKFSIEHFLIQEFAPTNVSIHLCLKMLFVPPNICQLIVVVSDFLYGSLLAG